MYLINNYINNIVNFDLLSRFPSWHSISHLPKIKNCVVQVSLKLSNELNYSIIDSFVFLEWLTGQRPLLKKVGFIYRHFKPLIHVVLHVTLRRFLLRNFLYYIVLCASLTPQKSIVFDSKISSNTLHLTIHDINFFFNIPETLYKFNEVISIAFELESNHSIDSSLIFWSSFGPLFFNKNNNILKK